MKAFFFILVIAFTLFIVFSDRKLQDAKDELTLMYLKRDMYGVVQCLDREVDNRTFIYCVSLDKGVINGLYEVEFTDDSYKLYALNGKAMAHVKNTNNAHIEVKRDLNLDFEKVYKAFK